MAKKVDLTALGQALDAISWQWLADTHPELSDAIAGVVADGAEARHVRSFVMQKTGRFELALRCEQAAAHLVSRQAAS